MAELGNKNLVQKNRIMNRKHILDMERIRNTETKACFT